MGDCILWEGARDKDGYGTVNVAGNKLQAHRYIYASSTKEDISGKIIRHTCDNPPCVNIAHLVPGTHVDNMRDMVARGRQRKARGTENSNAKLCEQDVRNIRKLIEEGEALNGIAKLFGVNPPTITAIKTGQNWGWLV